MCSPEEARYRQLFACYFTCFSSNRYSKTRGFCSKLQWPAMIPLALGNYVWDEGFRRGDGQLLAVMAYATPLCSALLLASLGAALLTWNLLTGAIVIVLAGLLSRADQ